MSNDNPSSIKYGRFYWGVETPKTIIMCMADDVSVIAGALVLRRVGATEHANLILAPGEWSRCWAASMLTGAPVAVDSENTKEREP